MSNDNQLTPAETKLLQRALKLYSTSTPESADEIRLQFHCPKTSAVKIYESLTGKKTEPVVAKPRPKLQGGDCLRLPEGVESGDHSWAVINLEGMSTFPNEKAARAAMANANARVRANHKEGDPHTMFDIFEFIW